MAEKLKPCPYCGGCPAIAGIVTEKGLIWRLRLGKGEHEDYPTREEAHEAWNRRASNDEGKAD
ncbi:MAG: hypothetical protein IJS28_07010 [Synergistaceae bacterium]|nr:hypothetical protein [Synergistaceae bacterium]